MIIDNGKYYLYRHIRLDKNEPFYIGIGGKNSIDIKRGCYSRAESNGNRRNNMWNKISKKTKYYCEILVESDDRDFIQEKEREFIKLYGRIDLKTGTLCNLTDGGDFGFAKSKVSIDKQIKSSKSNGWYYKNIERLKKRAESMKGVPFEKGYKKTYLYSPEGWFIKEFNNRKECSSLLKISYNKLVKNISERISCMGYFVTDYKTNKINIGEFKILRDKNREVVQVDENTLDFIWIYPSISIAAKEYTTTIQKIVYSISRNKVLDGNYWCYREDYPEKVGEYFELKNKKWA